MTLMQFSMIPLDRGPSFSTDVARVLALVDASGLDYRLTPMATVVEGEWEDLLALLTRCFEALRQDAARVSVDVKFDYRAGVRDALTSKIASVQAKSGRALKT